MVFKKKFLICILIITSTLQSIELKWDWNSIDVDAIKFDPSFIFGTAVAEHQVSGSKNSNWSRMDGAVDSKGKSRILNGDKCGIACDFWNNYIEDIELLKQLNVKAFRFSVEWSAIEPEKGTINYEAIAHYHALCNRLLEAGIRPVVTLHHFSHPGWFEDLGGFENEHNIKYFVNFSKLIVQELGSKVMMWATFNEPGVYVFQSYIRGVWPPHKYGMNRAGSVMLNMLIAHVEVYHAIKALPGGKNIKVGLVHSITQFDPYNDNFIERNICHILNHTFHDVITHFFQTGEFEYHVPLLYRPRL